MMWAGILLTLSVPCSVASNSNAPKCFDNARKVPVPIKFDLKYSEEDPSPRKVSLYDAQNLFEGGEEIHLSIKMEDSTTWTDTVIISQTDKNFLSNVDLSPYCNNVEILGYVTTCAQNEKKIALQMGKIQPQRNYLRRLSNQTLGLSEFQMKLKNDKLVVTDWGKLEEIKTCPNLTLKLTFKTQRGNITEPKEVSFSQLKEGQQFELSNSESVCNTENVTLSIRPKLMFDDKKKSYFYDTEPIEFKNLNITRPQTRPNVTFIHSESNITIQLDVHEIFYQCFTFSVEGRNSRALNDFVLKSDDVCKNTNLTVVVKDKDNKIESKIRLDPKFGIRLERNKTENWLVIDFNEPFFKNCNSIDVILECTNKTSKVNTAVSFTHSRFMLNDSFPAWNYECNGVLITTVETGSVVPGESVAVYVVMILFLAAVALVIWKREMLHNVVEKSMARLQDNDNNLQMMTNQEPEKSVELRKLLEVIENKNEEIMFDEFSGIEELSRMINQENTAFVAIEEQNQPRNRWKNILPFDKNRVHLKTETGDPPSSYINASYIKFPNRREMFLAVQAPKPNMIPSFWMMVREQNVSVIVMITELVQGKAKKADPYWPDDNYEIVYDNESINNESESFHKTYYHRRLTQTNILTEEKRVVHQLHNVSWKDKTAPEDTDTLLDLLEATIQIWDPSTGPLLVHCSAGVGRTGTFMGLCHLFLSLQDLKASDLSVYQTVLEMRKQRMKMVQKKEQYVYMYTCLAEIIRRELEKPAGNKMEKTDDEPNNDYVYG